MSVVNNSFSCKQMTLEYTIPIDIDVHSTAPIGCKPYPAMKMGLDVPEENFEHAFGAHIREGARIIGDWLRNQ